MNTKKTIIGLFALLVFMCGCGGKSPTSQTENLLQNKEGEAINNEMIVSYRNPEEGIWEGEENTIRGILQSCPNFVLDKNFNVHLIPQKATLYEYIRYNDCSKELYLDEYVKQYTELFRYFFPEKEMKRDCLYYGGFGSGAVDENGNRTFELLEGNEEKIRACQAEEGKPGGVWLLYDENRNAELKKWNDPIYMKLGVIFGYGYGEIDRGGILKKIGRNTETGTYQKLHSYEPEDVFPLVESYPPNSEESFSLNGKDVKICDAVTFFEQYINQVPYPVDANETTRVVEVKVVKVSETEYGYVLVLSAQYEGIIQDYGWDMISSDTGYMTRRYGRAFMLDGEEVDWIENYFRRSDIKEQTEITQIIPMESAVQIISQELSQNVSFQVRKLELVYFMEYIPDKRGYMDIENGTPHKVWPRYKLTLHNPNDNTEYICYVDAKDGKNFWYYKQYHDVGR